MQKSQSQLYAEQVSPTGWQIEIRHTQTYSVVFTAPMSREHALEQAVDAFKTALQAGLVATIYGEMIENYVEATAIEFPEEEDEGQRIQVTTPWLRDRLWDWLDPHYAVDENDKRAYLIHRRILQDKGLLEACRSLSGHYIEYWEAFKAEARQRAE